MTEQMRTKIEEISQGQDGFIVGWCDGGVSHFHFIWLRYRSNWKGGEGRY